MESLENLFQSIDFKSFDGQYLGREPYAFPAAGRRFYKLIGWDLLIQIFATGYDNCWLAKKGRLADDPGVVLTNNGKLDFQTAQNGFDKGFTIVVRHSERAHPKLKEIADVFQAHYQKPIDIQLYCTPEGEQGFDWHYDIEDVFVIQSSGQKEFRLLKNKNPHPPPFDEMPKNLTLSEHIEGPEIKCLLKPGDFLYIPSGHWHCANAITPSFHLSVGVLRR